jgi:deoxyribonuclease-4
MAILGAHQSIAGGYHRAVELARQCGCDCVQMFTKNANQWAAKTITREEARQFRQALGDLGVSHPIAHDSYLINLASPDGRLWGKSVDAFVAELRRAETLGIPYVVAHPGSYTTGAEQGGLANIVRALDEVHVQTRDLAPRCLLETTAGQGTTLGWQFE